MLYSTKDHYIIDYEVYITFNTHLAYLFHEFIVYLTINILKWKCKSK